MTTYLNEDQRGSGYYGLESKQSLGSQQAASTKLDNGGRWAPPSPEDKAAYVTYSFRSGASAEEMQSYKITGFQPLSGMQMAAVNSALNAWSDVANIFFNKAEATTYDNGGDILFGNYTSGLKGAAAFATYPNQSVHDVFFNISDVNNQSPVLGSYGYLTVVHEIGHAIGLSHPGIYNAGNDVSITYGANAAYFEDTIQYSVMSYFDASNSGGSHLDPYGSGIIRYASAPMMDDITAIQNKYGANMLTRVGNDTYGFNASSTVPNYYNSSKGPLVFCVWDAAGNDTFDFSGYSTSQLIDLRSGHFSNVGGMRGNVSIAINATIENAKAGSGGDVIHGNDSVNIIHGGAGNDTLYGYGGDDVFIGSDGMDYIDGGAGFDTLSYASNGVSGVHANTTGVSPEMGDDWTTSARVVVSGVERIITTNQKDLVDVKDGTVVEYKTLGGDDTFRLYYPLASSLILLDGGDGKDDLDMSTSVGPYTPIGATVYVDILPPSHTPGRSYYQTIHVVDIETIKGSKGADTFYLSRLSDDLTIDGNGDPGWSLDTVDFSLASSAVSGSFENIKNVAVIRGSSYGDTIDVQGVQTVYGGDGQDVFVARGGGTRFYGGKDGYSPESEIDTADLTALTSKVTISQQGGGWYYPTMIAAVTSTGRDDFLGIDRIVAGNHGIDVQYLGSIFKGQILGGSGDDSFTAGAGVSFDGGAGHDVVRFGASSTRMVFDGASIVSGGSELGQVTGFEELVGTTMDDVFRAGDGMIFRSGGGYDEFHTGRGGSTFYGEYQPYGGYLSKFICDVASTISICMPTASDPRPGVKDDFGNTAYGIGSVMGSSGDDLFILGTQGQGELPYRIDGGAGVDTLSLVDNTYFDATYGSFFTPGSVYTSAIISGFERFAANSGTVVGTTGNDDLIGSGTATMNGGSGNDEIWANGQSNAIGGDGNDVIHGLGSGWIDGGGGSDVIYAGPETAFAYGGAGDDVIYAVGANTTVKDQFGTNQIHVSGGAQVHFNVDSYNTLVSMKDTGGGIYEIKTGTGTTYVDGASEIYLDTYQGTSMIHLYAGLDYHDGMFF